MKTAKKLLALLIAVMMVLSCGITSFAVGEDAFADDLATARTFIDNLTVKSSTNIPSTITSTFGQQFSWDNEKRESANKNYLFEWSYYNGVVFEGLEYLYDYNSDETYRKYVEDYMSAMITENGTWAKTTNNSSKDAAGYVDYHGADCYKTASLLIDMAKDADGVVDKTSKYYKMATTLYNDLTKGTGSGYTDSSIGGNYWHSNWNSNNPPTYRLWIDGIYMIQPFLAEYAYYAEDEAQLNAIADRFEWLYENDRNATSGLYYHGLNSKTSYVPYHWGRAIGWYAMAVVDVMQYMDGENLETMKVILKDLVDNMLKVQDSTGMWSNLCDQPITSTNRLETSGSSMMAYTIAKGVNNGWLDESYGEFAKKAFSGIVDNKLSNGNLIDIYFKGSANGSDNYNNASNYYTNEGKGVGPFIMAYAQVLEMYENETAVEKPLVRLLTLSDYQKWSSNWTDDWAALQSQLNALVNGASGAGVDPDYMLFGGDYTCLDGANLANTGMGQVYSIIQSKWPQLTNDKILNVQGNHDAADFDGYCETGAYYYDNYIAYIINEDDYPSKQNGAAEEAIVRATTADLEAWLDEQIEKKETRPILIATHTGLHYDIDRADGNNQFASILFDAVNKAAKQLDIVFFFGHNHTNGDEQQGGSVNFFAKGDTLNVCTTTSIANKSGTPMSLNFTYMNYGYIGYVGSITNQPSEITPTDILTISELSFYGDRIEVKRYSANGLEPAYNETITIKNYPEWVEPEKYDIIYKLNNGEADKVDTVVVGENKIDTAVPEKDGFNFVCWTTNEDGTGDKYNPGDEITVSENVTLYAQWEEVVAPETNGAQYTLVDTITPGKQYIMVWNSNIADNSGIKYALTANGAAVTTTVIDEASFIAEDTILIPGDVDASAYTWDALYNNGVNPAQGFFFQNLATKNYLSNAGTALSIATDPIGTEAGQTDSDENSSLKFQDYVWNYRDYEGYNQLAMYSDTERYIRYSVGGGNLKLGTTATATDVNNSNVYLYEKVDPAEYRWELADTLESNERYLVVSSNQAGNAKMMTNTLRTFGSKDIEVKADEDGTLYIDYDLVYGDTGIFNAYLIREGSFWFDNWQDNGYSCVTRLNSGSIGATSSHGDDSYYFRFNYVDNKLVASSGLNGTATRSLVYNNGFTEGSGNGVYLYKLTEILPEVEPQPTSDLAIYLPFENATDGVSEDAAGEYDATLHNNAVIGEGFKGKGLVLDGNGAYASLPAGTNLLMDEDYSFSVWVKMNVHEDATHILDFGANDSHYAYLAINYTGGRGPRYTIKYDGTTVASVGPLERVSLNEWHHFAVTYGDNTMKLYLDGVLMDTETNTYTAAGLGNLANCWLGRSQFAVDPYLNGTIDEFKLYGDVLTAEEVAAQAAEEADPTPDPGPGPDPDPPVYETDENTLFLATDVHEYNQGVADVLGYINETVGVTPDNALFGGDFIFHITGNASQTETERAEVEATVNEVSPGTKAFFYQGNHDSISAANMDKTGLAAYNDHYVVYGINLSDLPSTVNALSSFLASYEDNPNYAGKPLFICSHCPLDETRRTDHAGGTATSYINLLNQYGDTIDIIFAFGHSHTEEFIDTFVPKGGTIDPENGIVGDKVELNFTYMNMGFITNKDYLYSAGTASDGTQHSSSLKSANYNPRTNSTGATAYEHVYTNRTDSAYATVDAVFFWDVTSATLATINEDKIVINRYGYGPDGTKENHPVKLLNTYEIALNGTEKQVDSKFDLICETFDYWQDVTKVIIDVGETVSSADIDKDTFSVWAKNYSTGDNSLAYDGARPVTAAYASDENGNKAESGKYITLELTYGVTQTDNYSDTSRTSVDGAATGHYPTTFKFYSFDMNYSITQNKPIGNLTISSFTQDEIKDEILDKFVRDKFTGTDETSVNYAFYTPDNADDGNKHPLMIWFHGMGEGGTINDGIQLYANRALAFADDEFQEAMDGAYFLAPQSPTRWPSQGFGGPSIYTQTVFELINSLIAENPSIDTDRIYVGGLSMGGYMAWQMILTEPDYFAGAIMSAAAFCPTEEEVKTVTHVPMWIVCSSEDALCNPQNYTEKSYNMLLDAGSKVAKFTMYGPTTEGDITGPFVWDGVRYSGHDGGWIPVYNNDPSYEDKSGNKVTIFEWLANQSLKNVIASAYTDDDVYAVNQPITITLTTGKDVSKVGIFNEAGKNVSKLSASFVTKGDKRIWTIVVSVATRGDRTLNIKGVGIGEAFADVDDIASVSFKVVKFIADTEQIAPSIDAASLDCPTKAKVNESFTFTVNTSKGVSNIGVSNESGAGLPIAKSYSDNGDVRTWTVSLSVATKGNRVLPIKICGEDGQWIATDCSLNITLVK